MSKLKFEIGVLFLLFTCQLKAQDFPFHYFTHLNPMVNNPSFAAVDEKMNVNVANYNLWAGGFKPLNDYLVSFSTPIEFTKNRRRASYHPRVGLGAVLLHENIGPFSQNILQLIYSYHIPLSKTAVLSFGINGLIENIGIDVNSLSPLLNDDLRILTGNNNSFLFDGGFGSSISGKDYRISFSVLNLAPSVFKFKNSSAESIGEYRKLFLSGSYSIKISEKLLFQPEFTLRNTIQNKFSFDSLFDFDLSLFSFGVGYRSENSVFIFTKISVHDFVFSYTSENPIKSNHMIGNGHTFSMGWSFDLLNR
jgi:type IX secretion system PorP/SprF family membrane protein